MKFVAVQVPVEEILPGEMFSAAGSDYWDGAASGTRGSIGERVYLRTLAPVPEEDVGTFIYRITVKVDTPMTG